MAEPNNWYKNEDFWQTWKPEESQNHPYSRVVLASL